MKIGIDITPLPPNPVGAGTYIIQLVRAIAALPAELCTIAVKKADTKHPTDKEYPIEFVLFAQPGGREAVGEIQSDRVSWVMTPEMSPARRLVWEQTQLPFLVRRAGVDLLHSLHYTRPLILPCFSVVTFHDMTFFLFPDLHTRAKRLFFPYTIRLSAGRADALIAVSESTRRDALRILDIPPERITTVPLGISADFHPIDDRSLLEERRQRYHLPDEFILYVGLIEPRKNLPLLLRAYARLIQREEAPDLVLVGDIGWMAEPIFQLIKELNLAPNVHFTGYIPHQDLPIVYNLAKIFIYPSNYEGFGFPPLEAMACGTPVITTAVSAMLDNVGDAGMLTPPQDEQALTEAMHQLLKDSSLRENLSQKGRQRAVEFTWRRTAIETLHIYKHVGAKV